MQGIPLLDPVATSALSAVLSVIFLTLPCITHSYNDKKSGPSKKRNPYNNSYNCTCHVTPQYPLYAS